MLMHNLAIEKRKYCNRKEPKGFAGWRLPKKPTRVRAMGGSHSDDSIPEAQKLMSLSLDVWKRRGQMAKSSLDGRTASLRAPRGLENTVFAIAGRIRDRIPAMLGVGPSGEQCCDFFRGHGVMPL